MNEILDWVAASILTGCVIFFATEAVKAQKENLKLQDRIKELIGNIADDNTIFWNDKWVMAELIMLIDKAAKQYSYLTDFIDDTWNDLSASEDLCDLQECRRYCDDYWEYVQRYKNIFMEIYPEELARYLHEDTEET